jgi:FixJ family two-component response regulator
MPETSGPALQRELGVRGHEIPIVFITAQPDEAVRAHLRQQGAVDVLFKPFSELQLRAALDAALRRD